MYPDGDIPTFQLSLDYDKPFAWHFALAKELQELRKKGVLIIGSGNLVHNLQRVMFGGKPFDWNIEFDTIISRQILDRDFGSILQKK
jgi:4,5-DOPA dioxygenase extradiol